MDTLTVFNKVLGINQVFSLVLPNGDLIEDLQLVNIHDTTISLNRRPGHLSDALMERINQMPGKNAEQRWIIYENFILKQHQAVINGGEVSLIPPLELEELFRVAQAKFLENRLMKPSGLAKDLMQL
ncbi:unnamed protein product [Bursaphelenchus okinawaensis]|uniref:Uncharacterized protein n=1 Tax=Bursaphelenchus okinawaensis TaxID=465554 RepID=A0A811K5K8_9BILA|nr:unnamed protein product [Bursaphelenchus okinawaensis]CAG9091861.1 unnamed protein product [Bursaphelenchus okinawaensis]